MYNINCVLCKQHSSRQPASCWLTGSGECAEIACTPDREKDCCDIDTESMQIPQRKTTDCGSRNVKAEATTKKNINTKEVKVDLNW